MKLISVIRNVAPKLTDKHGFVIFFGDIFNACKIFGHDNHHLLEVQLKELEQQGLLSIVYQDEYEDLIIGVKFND